LDLGVSFFLAIFTLTVPFNKLIVVTPPTLSEFIVLGNSHTFVIVIDNSKYKWGYQYYFIFFIIIHIFTNIMSDSSLYNEKLCLLQIAAGDQRAFAELLDHYRPNIYTTTLRITRDPGLTNEILQDAFLKVWLKRKDLPVINNFGGWLFTISKNLTFNALKRIECQKKRMEELDQDLYHLIASAEEEVSEQKDYKTLLKTAIGRLPRKQQQTYKLIKQQGMKRDIAAQALKVSPETVKSNLKKAICSIRTFCLSQKEAWIILLLFHLTN
jgi:RNA polymerase sigma factor (sigma-70 family)